MTQFIHLLPTPACVLSFDGDIIDVNDLMVKDSKCTSVFEFMNFSASQLCLDKTKHKAMVDYLLSGGELINQQMILHFFDGTTGLRTTNISIISKEKKTLLVQNYGNYQAARFFSEKSIFLSKMKKLSPFLNNKGKELLDNIIESEEEICANLSHYEDEEIIVRELNKKMGWLTESETRIAALLTLGFSTKEINRYTGYTSNKIRVNIHRICKKLNLSSRKELSKMLIEMLSN